MDNQMVEIQSNSTTAGHVARKVMKQEHGRFVPVVLPISNPTIGVGLAGGILYMHPNKSGNEDSPTSTSGVFGMYTDSKSWAAGGFHDGYYLDDRIRFRVPAAYAEFNVKYYGVGQDSPLRDNPIDYSGDGEIFIPRVSFELPLENWFFGGQYRLINIQTIFDENDQEEELPEDAGARRTAGIGLVTLFDSRDSNLWPSKGNWLDFTATFNGEYVGGDYEYQKYEAKWAQYFSFMKYFIAVYRIDGQLVGGEAPFWDLSRIRLRGFAGGEYLDNAALTVQAELRWNIYRKWTVLAFGGSGRIADAIEDIGDADDNLAGGAGFRYMLVEEQKLMLGIDVAYTDTAEVAVYFQVGDWLAN